MNRYRVNTEPIRVDRWFRARGALSVLTFNRACELGELLLCSCMSQYQCFSVSVFLELKFGVALLTV